MTDTDTRGERERVAHDLRTIASAYPLAMATLRELDQESAALEALLADLGGDVTDEEAERIIDQWLAENEKKLAEKIDGYATLIRQAEGRAKLREEEGDRLRRLAAVDANLAKRMKERLRHFMTEKGLTRLDGKYYRVTIATNGGHQPIEVLVSPNDLPEWAKRTTVEADHGALREALVKNPEQAAGLARLLPRGNHVRIA